MTKNSSCIPKTLSTREVDTVGSLTWVVEDVDFGSGTPVRRGYVKHPGAVVIIPLLGKNTVVFIEQYRHPLRKAIVELPAGTLEAGEDPRQCAAREIMEETGYRAGALVELGSLFATPGFCNEVQHVFLATDLTPASLSGDEDEKIDLYPRDLSEVESLIVSGELSDSKSISALSLARARRLLTF